MRAFIMVKPTYGNSNATAIEFWEIQLDHSGPLATPAQYRALLTTAPYGSLQAEFLRSLLTDAPANQWSLSQAPLTPELALCLPN
jgi:hypothetical protein